MEDTSKDLSQVTLDPSKDYFFGIRHGQRADKDGGHYDDIPLTEFGVNQAKESGKIMNELLQRSKISKVTLIVSPFLRTMQTAQEVARECGIKDMKIDMGFMESLYEHAFTENPLLKLETRLLTASEFEEKRFDSDISVTYPSEEEWKKADEVFPEKLGEDFTRLYKGFDNVLCKYPSEDKEGSNVIILVGHGSMVMGVTDYIEKSDKIVDYCSIGCIEFDREGDGKRVHINRF